jgi:uncharacterized protein (DUF983 family)
VLLTGALTLVAFFVITGVVTAADRPDWLAVAIFAAFVVLVTLPMLRPVRDELHARRHDR